jgi:hypothetical protein
MTISGAIATLVKNAIVVLKHDELNPRPQLQKS